MTFKEAYIRTGRILNISVTPADRHSYVPFGYVYVEVLTLWHQPDKIAELLNDAGHSHMECATSICCCARDHEPCGSNAKTERWSIGTLELGQQVQRWLASVRQMRLAFNLALINLRIQGGYSIASIEPLFQR
jgi:hypothetical protein